MKYITAIILFFISTASFADDGFIQNFGDVPLMDGMTEITEEHVVFDTPQGTVAEATLEGQMAPSAVFSFYEKSLLALGWTQDIGAKEDMRRVFTRGAQHLTLTMSFNNTLTLRLKPKTS